MTEAEHRQQILEHVRASLHRIRARWYAVDQHAETSLTALAIAWIEWQNQNDDKFRFSADALDKFLLDNIGPFVPGFMQQQPDAAPPKPTPWRDEITGEVAQNPWLTKDLSSQTVVRERDPILAEHLKRIAKDGGVSCKYLSELQDAETKRQLIAAIRYGKEEDDSNVFRGKDLAARSAFVRNNPPEVVQFYRNEVARVRLPFSPASRNLTITGAIGKHNDAAGKIVHRAAQIEQRWIDEEIEAAKQAKVEAETKLQAAEKRLSKLPK